MSQFSVDDIVIGKHDSNNREVLDVYARQSGRYAVYQTDRRVVIAYADDPLVQKIQRKRLAPLALLRSEIDGMLGPWRGKKEERSRLVETARQFDMRVASALIEAMEGDSDCARTILGHIRDDIRGEMGSRARLAYVIWAVVSALAVLAGCSLVYVISDRVFGGSLIGEDQRRLLLAGMSTGVLGALYSIAMRIEQRCLSNDMRRLDSITDSFVRLGLGAMGAFILGCFLLSGAIEINFGVDIKPGADRTSGNFIYLVLITGFLAGFVERLVPDLLNSYSVVGRTTPAPTPAPSPAPAPAPDAAAAVAVAAGVGDGELPADENAVITPPSEEEDVDGCDAHAGEGVPVTADEELPSSSGGVAAH